MADSVVTLDIDAEEAIEKLEQLKPRVMAAVEMLQKTNAAKLKSYMQRNRPWTDRTGEAKRRLDAVVSKPDDHTVRITLSHGVDYGKWLELAHEAKYAIIRPTIKKEGPDIYDEFQNFLEKVVK